VVAAEALVKVEKLSVPVVVVAKVSAVAVVVEASGD
jgi:hypothetical protein